MDFSWKMLLLASGISIITMGFENALRRVRLHNPMQFFGQFIWHVIIIYGVMYAILKFS